MKVMVMMTVVMMRGRVGETRAGEGGVYDEIRERQSGIGVPTDVTKERG